MVIFLSHIDLKKQPYSRKIGVKALTEVARYLISQIVKDSKKAFILKTVCLHSFGKYVLAALISPLAIQSHCLQQVAFT